MKKIRFLITLCAISLAAISQAYEFSFYNNTNDPVAIAIQYTGNDNIPEPLYKQLAKPKEMIIFTPGKLKIPDIKWGFCLDTISYVQNPTTEQKAHNFEKAPWRKTPITWTEEKSVTKRKEKKPAPTKNTPAAPAAAKSEKTTATPAAPAAPAAAKSEKTTATPAAPAASAQKSLCRDRHFDIIADEHNKISITSSLKD